MTAVKYRDQVTGQIGLMDDVTGQILMPPGSVGAADTPGLAPGGDFTNAPGKTDITLFENSIPTSKTFDNHLVPNPDFQDIVFTEFYDSVAVTSAAAQTPTLFVQPAVANAYNSNAPGNGVLNNNERFMITGIRFELENNDTTNPLDIVDVVQSLRLGTYELKVANKVYNSGKMLRFIDPETFFAVNTKYYSVKPFVTWKLPLPVFVGKQYGFSVITNFTAATLDATTRLFCYLGGFWYRSVQ